MPRRSLPRYVYPHPSGYIVHWWADGKRRTKTFRDLVDALAFWAVTHGDARTPQTVGQLCDSYLAGRLYQSLAEATQRDYLKQIAKIRAAIGEMRARDVTTAHIAAMHEHLGKRSHRQANYMRSVAQQVFRWGRMQGVVNHDPCRSVQRFRETPRTRLVTDEELAAVLAVCPPSVRLAALLASITGLRQGDILALRFADWSDAGLRVRTGKTGRALHFEPTAGLVDCFEIARTISPKVREYVICKRDGHPYTGDGFRSIWHRCVRKVDVQRFTFHDLRAKAGSESQDWRLLGHSARAIFDRVYDRAARKVRPVR